MNILYLEDFTMWAQDLSLENLSQKLQVLMENYKPRKECLEYRIAATIQTLSEQSKGILITVVYENGTEKGFLYSWDNFGNIFIVLDPKISLAYKGFEVTSIKDFQVIL